MSIGISVKESAQGYLWILFLIVVIVTVIGFSVGGPALDKTANSVGNSTDTSYVENTINNVMNSIRYFPIVLLGGLLLYALASIAFKEGGRYRQ